MTYLTYTRTRTQTSLCTTEKWREQCKPVCVHVYISMWFYVCVCVRCGRTCASVRVSVTKCLYMCNLNAFMFWGSHICTAGHHTLRMLRNDQTHSTASTHIHWHATVWDKGGTELPYHFQQSVHRCRNDEIIATLNRSFYEHPTQYKNAVPHIMIHRDCPGSCFPTSHGSGRSGHILGDASWI